MSYMDTFRIKKSNVLCLQACFLYIVGWGIFLIYKKKKKIYGPARASVLFGFAAYSRALVEEDFCVENYRRTKQK